MVSVVAEKFPANDGNYQSHNQTTNDGDQIIQPEIDRHCGKKDDGGREIHDKLSLRCLHGTGSRHDLLQRFIIRAFLMCNRLLTGRIDFGYRLKSLVLKSGIANTRGFCVLSQFSELRQTPVRNDGTVRKDSRQRCCILAQIALACVPDRSISTLSQ